MSVVRLAGSSSDAAAVGLPHATTGSAVVCVAALGRAFRPKRVIFVSDLPKTRSMQVMRRVVRTALAGQAPGDPSSLANPEAVQELARHANGNEEEQA